MVPSLETLLAGVAKIFLLAMYCAKAQIITRIPNKAQKKNESSILRDHRDKRTQRREKKRRKKRGKATKEEWS